MRALRADLRRIVESETVWVVFGEPRDGKETTGETIESNRTLLYSNYSMPLINGAEATRQIRARLPTRFCGEVGLRARPSVRIDLL
jgi:DNA-binding NarL/FixJ family response regulator